MDSISIVGASLAGIRAAQTLRGDGFAGRITLIGDEPHRPYDRPPLSKESLFSPDEISPLELVNPEDYKSLELDEKLGWEATSLNPAELSVDIENSSSKETITSQAILIATGARARNIFDTSLAGVYTLRTFDDCKALRQEFQKSPGRVVVIGAGFIGCEVASSARSLGLEVSMIEMTSQPLAQVLGEEVGSCIADIHTQNGVDLRLNTAVKGLTGDKNVEAVELDDGTSLEADLVIVGAGAIPNTEWLDGSGLTIDAAGRGVVCDQFCMAAPGVAAAGDVASWHNPRFVEQMRVEHWDNAIEQSKFAVRNLLAGENGKAEPYCPIPWFWSDQYEHKIQLSGLSSPDDEFEILEGDISENKFVAVYKREGKIRGVLGLNSARLVMKNRQLIETDFPAP